ncbi:MAG: serine hydrolase, partial [Bacteroidota bacterium]
MKYSLLILALVIAQLLLGQETYFPPDHTTGEWETIDLSSLNWSADSITGLYNFLEEEQTKAFLVLKDGKIVLEQYFGTYQQDSIHPWFSAGKSLRAFLVGQAQEDGFLDIN